MQQVKIIPKDPMYIEGRLVKYIICEPTQVDMLKIKTKRASNLKSSRTAIKCINNGKEYKSIREASEDLGLDAGGISRCINDKQSTTGGYVFKKL